MRRASRTATARLHRLSGQLAAVEGMLMKRRSCTEVLQQISAVRAGLEQVAGMVVQKELQRLSSKKAVSPKDIEKLIQAFNKTT